MKTIQQIEKYISVLLEKERKDTKTTEDNRDRKKLRLMTLCKYYLETNPNEQFVIDEKIKVKTQIDLIVAKWKLIDSTGALSTKAKNAFYSENNMKTLKEQFTALNYLL
jgi:hypothetical protein